MKVSLRSLIDSLNKLRYDFSSYEGEDAESIVVDISILEENLEKGQLPSCLMLKAESSKPKNQYRKELNVTRVLEIFSKEDNMPPKLTRSETQTLD